MEMAGDRLERYRSKRDFARTPEPSSREPAADRPAGDGDEEGSTPRSRSPQSSPAATSVPAPAGVTAGMPTAGTFVVQQHAARRMHYDVRLEVGGVLASWAVPNGPSYDPKVKRLAVHVEDHPLDYAGFEGGIPAGEYGGGRVIVWDAGTYANLTQRDGRPVPVEKAIERGHLSVWLEGSKLRGGWSLTRTTRPGQRQDSWLMVKRSDERAVPGYDVTVAEPASVVSGRRVEDLTAGEPTWTRARATWVPPMLAELTRDVPGPTEGWVFERKFDGLRAVAVRNGDEVELWSRNHRSFAARFPGVVAALAALPVDNLTLDGELVAYEHGHTSFELLQRSGSRAVPVYEVFDVLHLLGNDTTALPWRDRHLLVTELLGSAPSREDGNAVLRAVEVLSGDPQTLRDEACRSGWEGLIAKRVDAAYTPGRSRDWRKLKCDARQELVIGGWTEPRGSRQRLGAILVGYYDGSGQLRYAGKVGSGFDEATLRELRSELDRRTLDTPPFVDTPRDIVRSAHFVRPELVANVVFSEWTADGRLRHPRFQGLRPDKDAASVVRERPRP